MMTSGSLAQFFAVVSKALLDQAWRDNRRYDRVQKRERHHCSYSSRGLNGPRAVARRRRQIEAGSIRAENGLVRSC